jgi:hypothetical protein
MAPNLPDLARRVDDEGGDPGDALETIVAIRRRLDGLEARQVDAALAAGWSWSRIAGALGVTKQAAHRRHSRRRRAAVSAPSQPPVARPGTATERRRLTITGEARRAVEHAREEAAALNAPGVAPEHLLLGLLRSPDCAAARALEAAGVSLEAARAQVDELATETGRRAPSDAPPGGRRLAVLPEGRGIFEQALREAVARRDAHLGVEHILLALARAERDTAATVFVRLGIEQAAVVRSLGEILWRRAGTG